MRSGGGRLGGGKFRYGMEPFLRGHVAESNENCAPITRVMASNHPFSDLTCSGIQHATEALPSYATRIQTRRKIECAREPESIFRHDCAANQAAPVLPSAVPARLADTPGTSTRSLDHPYLPAPAASTAAPRTSSPPPACTQTPSRTASTSSPPVDDIPCTATTGLVRRRPLTPVDHHHADPFDRQRRQTSCQAPNRLTHSKQRED